MRDFCDVGISGLIQTPEPHLRERIAAAGFLKKQVPREEFMRYRGVFDIDGNANAWSGLFCSLLGASCVLKVTSQQGFREWYYSDLKPWHHYIPIQSDLSDLSQAVHWFAEHDAQAREIGARGRELALEIDIKSAVRASTGNLLSWLKQRLG